MCETETRFMNSLGEKIFLALFKLKRRLGTPEAHAVRVPVQMNERTSVLICFPSEESDLRRYQNFLNHLLEVLPEKALFLILHRTQLNALKLPARASVLTYDQRDFTRFGTLKRAWLTALPKDVFLTLDLNEGHSLWSAHLSFQTHAPLRLAFQQEQGDIFCNILLRSRAGAEFSEKMEQVIQSVRALINPPKVLAA